MPGPAPALASQEASMTTLLEKNHGPANGHGGMEAIKHATTNFSPTLLVNITLLENTWPADLHVGEPIQLITPASGRKMAVLRLCQYEDVQKDGAILSSSGAVRKDNVEKVRGDEPLQLLLYVQARAGLTRGSQ